MHTANLLLASLSAGDVAAIQPYLKEVRLEHHKDPVRGRRPDPCRLLSDNRDYLPGR